ncbi:MAG: PQQ-binding-like beta-propeller repeat protein [Planctomycetota bacterium]
MRAAYRLNPRVVLQFTAFCFLSVSAAVAAAADQVGSAPTGESELARKILASAKVAGGVVLHLGCGEGHLTAALHDGGRFVVRGLEADAAAVERARAYVDGQGIYGPVSIAQFDGDRLPLADNLVNVLVAEDLQKIVHAEALRVVVPGGSLFVQQNGQWKRWIKSRPESIDEWTHTFYDASNNPVAHDSEVGPPGRLQWTAGPRYTRSHEHIPSLYSLVSSDGKIFYLVDEGPTFSLRQAPQWQLMARDAFNGVVLWKRPVKTWYPHIIGWGSTPRQLERRVVAVGDRVYATLGLQEPVSVLDAATGKTIRELSDTAGAEEILVHEGVILVLVREIVAERTAELARFQRLLGQEKSLLDDRETADPLVKKLRAVDNQGALAIHALDAASGRLLWKDDSAEAGKTKPDSLSALGTRVYFQSGSKVYCRDLKTGQSLWAESAPPLRSLGAGRVVCGDGDTVAVLDAASGKTLWTEKPLLADVRDAFVIGDSLWLGGFRPHPKKGKHGGPSWGPYFAIEHDLATGKVLKQIEPENPGHHHRCYANKATEQYILGGRRGTEFIDLAAGEVLWNSWARGVCKYGVMPANGLLYVPPHACGCYIAVKLTGFNAMAAREGPEQPKSGPPILEAGPAFGSMSGSTSAASAEWSTYRGNAARSARVAARVPATVQPLWQVQLGDRITAPTVSRGKVLVASPDEHRVIAVDAASGKELWRFIAGGRVDSPPTLVEGQAIFGCRDGSVYNLRMDDGALAWRLVTARAARQIVVDGQLESVSPVHGSVLESERSVYFTAGRNSYLDGGLDLYRVDPRGGSVMCRTPIYSPDPETGHQPPQSAPGTMPGVRADILSSEGDHVYLRDMTFDKQARPVEDAPAHLFTLTDYLDDTWSHRSYWIMGTHCTIATGCSGQEKGLLFGRLLASDEKWTYGYGRERVHWSNQLLDGPYRLFCVAREDKAVRWNVSLPIQVEAMVVTEGVVFVAGPPAESIHSLINGPEQGQGRLLAISTEDGSVLSQCDLGGGPVFDGMAAVDGRLFVSLDGGRLMCLAGK